MDDIRDQLFGPIQHQQITAKIVAVDAGILAGTADAKKEADRLGLTVLQWLVDGAPVKPGDAVTCFSGSPKQIAVAEEVLMGHMAKFSGIATAAKSFVDRCGDRPKVVSGSWKKMPIQLKDNIRSAITTGGAAIRISDTPFLYLDKNYTKMLGGIATSLKATNGMENRKRVVQIYGHFGDIATEALEAAENGADIIFIDTGSMEDVASVGNILTEKNLRQQVEIVFAGGVRLEDLELLKKFDIDLLDVGRSIVDAPLLDMRLEIVRQRLS